MNSGAEAVETAVKIARKWAYESKKIPKYEAEIICCADNFHGRTLTVISFSTSRSTATPSAVHAGLQDHPVRRRRRAREGDHPQDRRVPGRAIQGEAGVVVPPRATFKRVAELCKRTTCSSSPTRSRTASRALARCSRATTRA